MYGIGTGTGAIGNWYQGCSALTFSLNSLTPLGISRYPTQFHALQKEQLRSCQHSGRVISFLYQGAGRVLAVIPECRHLQKKKKTEDTFTASMGARESLNQGCGTSCTSATEISSKQVGRPVSAKP